MYLFVQPSGTRSWVQRIAIRGRRHELGLGSTVLVPLAEAPAKALANRRIARECGDPLAFEMLVLTAARWGEIRGAEWPEIDTAGRLWTVPAARMKAQRVHRVPLSGRAMEIIEAARTLSDGSGPLVFPAKGGAPLPEKKLRRLLQDLNVAAAYARSDLFERRRRLTDQWAAYVDGER